MSNAFDSKRGPVQQIWLARNIGQMKLQELRARAEQALAEQFAVRQFQPRVFGRISLPLTILKQRVDDWIAAQQLR